VGINSCFTFWFLNIHLQKGEGNGAEEMKETSPQAGSFLVSRVETEVEQVSNYNYFSPGLMVKCSLIAVVSNYRLFGHLCIVFLLILNYLQDVWPEILDKLTEPTDVFTMMNTSPVLNSLTEIQNLKMKALFPLVRLLLLLFL